MSLHSLLERQLRRVGLENGKTPPDEAAWGRFLERVDRAYAQADQDRYLLERSLSISSREMGEINEQLEVDRGKLEEALAEIEHKHRQLGRVYEFFRVTLDHMLVTVRRGSEQSELLAYLEHVRSEFDGIE